MSIHVHNFILCTDIKVVYLSIQLPSNSLQIFEKSWKAMREHSNWQNEGTVLRIAIDVRNYAAIFL